jgi:hypothetical protein
MNVLVHRTTVRGGARRRTALARLPRVPRALVHPPRPAVLLAVSAGCTGVVMLGLQRLADRIG